MARKFDWKPYVRIPCKGQHPHGASADSLATDLWRYRNRPWAMSGSRVVVMSKIPGNMVEFLDCEIRNAATNPAPRERETCGLCGDEIENVRDDSSLLVCPRCNWTFRICSRCGRQYAEAGVLMCAHVIELHNDVCGTAGAGVAHG